ncbi:MAG TPA: hypothetical protein VGS07_06110 [Thermoanaerobaculia bacterium]|jgi:hypothetical protein|nr:hypothetical protein [Thermoanaerobaculia bacterium]
MIMRTCVEPEKNQENPTVRLRPKASPFVRLLEIVLGLAILAGFVPVVFAAPPGEDPAKVGRWSDVIQFAPPVVAIHAHLLPTGKVLLW